MTPFVLLKQQVKNALNLFRGKVLALLTSWSVSLVDSVCQVLTWSNLTRIMSAQMSQMKTWMTHHLLPWILSMLKRWTQKIRQYVESASRWLKKQRERLLKKQKKM